MLKTTFRVPVLPTYTYATLPSAAAAGVGAVVRASDIGIAPGMRLVSDGTRWLPDGLQVLARTGVLASVTGTLTETTLGSVSVPAGLLGLEGSLRVTALWSMTNSANNKNGRIRLGGTAFLDYAYTATASHQVIAIVRNRNSATAQVANNLNAFGFSTSTSSQTTGTVDTTVAQTLVVTGQLTNTGESFGLQGYTVEILP